MEKIRFAISKLERESLLNKQKGFTLIELLGVIVLLGCLALVLFPPLLKQINKAKDSISETTKMLIIDASKDYYEDNKKDFKKVDGVSYCINVNTIVEQNYLNGKLKDKDLNDINTNKEVKLTYLNNKFNYELVDSCNYYTVMFDANGGNVDIEKKQVLENSLYGELPTPTREGYTFMGWQGSNLLNYNNISLAAFNNDIVVDENGCIKNITLLDPRAWLHGNSDWVIDLCPGTYTLTLYFLRQSTNVEVASIALLLPNNESLLHSSDITFKDKKSFSFSISEEQKLGILIKAVEGIYRIKLEKGESATSWEPYRIINKNSLVMNNESHTLIALWQEN